MLPLRKGRGNFEMDVQLKLKMNVTHLFFIARKLKFEIFEIQICKMKTKK